MTPHPVFFVHHQVHYTSPTSDGLQREMSHRENLFHYISYCNILLSGNSGYAESIVAGQHSLFLPLLLSLIL